MSDETLAEKIDVMVVRGVEGHCLYVGGTRVAGPKPWGGGDIVTEWRSVSVHDLRKALSSEQA